MWLPSISTRANNTKPTHKITCRPSVLVGLRTSVVFYYYVFVYYFALELLKKLTFSSSTRNLNGADFSINGGEKAMPKILNRLNILQIREQILPHRCSAQPVFIQHLALQSWNRLKPAPALKRRLSSAFKSKGIKFKH